MSGPRAPQGGVCQRTKGGSHASRRAVPQSQEYDLPADFSKVDSILKYLQQPESHDWLGEISHCCAQVCYLLLQNYNISRLNFYNYNFHLIVLTALFFARRIWFFLWGATTFSDQHGRRFSCHIVLFLVLLNSLYCSVQLTLKDSGTGLLYLTAPMLSGAIFYQVYLKVNSNVFTTEIFSMLWRCMYHSVEAAYFVGVLPLKFLQHEYIYVDTWRCLVLTMLTLAHVFISFFCLELHCLGSEVLQQAKMLGGWQLIPDLSRLKSISPKPMEWAHQNCPYPRGAVVQCKGRYYEAMSTLNTCSPACPSQYIYLIVFALGDSQSTRVLVLAALLFLNMALVCCVLWSSQWPMYAVMLVPNACQFFYVKYRRKHAFFNPAHLNLRQIQWDLKLEVPQHKLNGFGQGSGDSHRRGWANHSDGLPEDEGESSRPPDDPTADGAVRNGGNHGTNNTSGEARGSASQCPDAFFMSAVAASTMFFLQPFAGEPP